MKFKDIQKLSDVKFRRLTGVSWATFNLMLAEINKQLPRHIGKGRPHKLPLEDRLLLCIEYWRENRTFFHLGMSYGVSETSAIRITRFIEDTLIGSGKFNLPKQLPNRDEVDWEVVVIDATEILVQRPKKNRRNGIAVKKSDIPLNFSYLCTIQQVKYSVYVEVMEACMILKYLKKA